MSDMSQAQSQTGGDPLDLVNATGTEDDVMPGPADVDAAPGQDASDDVSGGAMDMGNEDPAPEGGASLDPPGTDVRDPASGVDPLNEAEVSGMQAPGEGGDLQAGADPMPDMSGTTPNSPRP
jgi:hypothetical protein